MQPLRGFEFETPGVGSIVDNSVRKVYKVLKKGNLQSEIKTKTDINGKVNLKSAATECWINFH